MNMEGRTARADISGAERDRADVLRSLTLVIQKNKKKNKNLATRKSASTR